MRDYGIEPVIWDGDKNCKHNFDNIQRYNPTRGKRDGKGIYKDPKWEAKGSLKKEVESNFCTICGAWRGSLGLEPTFESYIKHLCDIFDEVKRVLRKDGTCWVNLGTTMQDKNDVMIPERFALEMTNPNYILRDDLTKEEKEYVLTSLINNGII